MMFSDPSYYLEKNIDADLWKYRFYIPIDVERSALSHHSKPYSPEEIKRRRQAAIAAALARKKAQSLTAEQQTKTKQD